MGLNLDQEHNHRALLSKIVDAYEGLSEKEGISIKRMRERLGKKESIGQDDSEAADLRAEIEARQRMRDTIFLAKEVLSRSL